MDFAPLSPFQMKQGKGLIDVWWLYDDGGNRTILLVYIRLKLNLGKQQSPLNFRSQQDSL